MLDKIISGNYFPTQSNIHNMNPIAKILCTLLFLLMTIFSFNIEVSAILILLMMIIIMNTNIPLAVYYYIIKKFRYIIVLVFIIFVLLTLSFTGGITALIDITLIILSITILTMTTPLAEIVCGLEKILKPLQKINIKTNKLALNISVGLRIIPELINESDKILKIQASRGIDYNISIKNKIKAIKNMIKPAIKRTIEKQKQLKQEMELRMFSINRTNYKINKWTFFDIYMLIIHITVLIIIIIRGVI